MVDQSDLSQFEVPDFLAASQNTVSKPLHAGAWHIDRTLETSSGDETPIRIGDVIFLSRCFDSMSIWSAPSANQGEKADQKPNLKTLYLVSQGLSDSSLTGEVLENNKNAMAIYCLFRVEPAHKYEELEKIEPDDTSSNEDQGISARIRAQKDTDRIRKEVIKSCQGQPVLFGQNIQLRHIHSNGYLSISHRPGRVSGSWEMTLDFAGSRQCWLKLLPSSRKRQQGDEVRYCDPSMVSIDKSHLEYFLASTAIKGKWSIGAYHRPCSWNINRYTEVAADKRYLHFGGCVKFNNQQTGLDLSISPCNKFEQRYGDLVSQQRQMEKLQLRSKHMTYNDVWVIENMDEITGGKVEKNQKAYLRNASTNQYLNPDLTLSDTPQEKGYITFKEPQETQYEQHILLQSELYLQVEGRVKPTEDCKGWARLAKLHQVKELLIEADDQEIKDDIIYRVMPTKSTGDTTTGLYTNEVKLQEKSSTSKSATFTVNSVRDELASYMLKVGGLVPMFLDYYGYLKQFGINSDGVREYNHAIQQESELRDLTVQVERGIQSVITLILQSGATDSFEYRQNFFCALGLYYILIKIALHISNLVVEATQQDQAVCSVNPVMVDVVRRHSGCQFYSEKIYNRDTNSYEPSIYIIVGNTKNLIEKIFEVLNLVTFQNKANCVKVSKMSEDLFMLLPLDNKRKLSVGNLLVEMFRVIEPELRDPFAFIEKRCKKLTMVSMDNHQEQSLRILLLRYICETNEGQVNAEFQKHLTDIIFMGENNFPMLKILRVQGRPCFQFLTCNLASQIDNSQSAGEFLSLNPELFRIKNFGVENTESLNELYFYFNELTDQAYVKYVHTVLMLFNTMCKSKNEFAQEYLKSQLGFLPNLVVDLATSEDTHLLIREAFIELAGTLILRAGPHVSAFNAFKCKNMCFRSDDIYKFSSPESDLMKCMSDPENENIKRLIEWSFVFWIQDEPPYEESLYSFEHRLAYLSSALQLTSTLIDYQHTTLPYMQWTSMIWVHIIQGYENSARRVMKANNHWVTKTQNETFQGRQPTGREVALCVDLMNYSLFIYKLTNRYSLQDRCHKLLQLFDTYKDQLINPNDVHAPGKGIDEWIKNEIQQQMLAITSDTFTITKVSQILQSIQKPPEFEIEQPKLGKQKTTVVFTDIDEEEFLSVNTVYKKCCSNVKAISENNGHVKEFLTELIFSHHGFSREQWEKLVDLSEISYSFNNQVYKYLEKADILSNGYLEEKADELRDLVCNLPIETLCSNFYKGRIQHCEEYEVLLNELKKVLKHLELRSCTQEYVFRKTQNIMRHVNLHVKLMQIWFTYLYFRKLNDRIKNPETLYAIYAHTTTLVYYFCVNNDINRRAVLSTMHTENYDPMMYRTPFIIREISSFDHINHDDIQLFIEVVIKDAAFEGGKQDHKNSFRFISMMMFGLDGQPKTETQCIVSRIIVEILAGKLQHISGMYPNCFGNLLFLLGQASQSNETVARQCQRLVPMKLIIQMVVDSWPRVDKINAMFHFFTWVYFSCGMIKTNADFYTQIVEFFNAFSPMLDEALEYVPMLTEYAAEGLIEQVYQISDPMAYDIRSCYPIPYIKGREVWRFISRGDRWETKFGFFEIFPTIICELKQDHTALQNWLKEMQRKCSTLVTAIQDMSDECPDFDFTLLLAQGKGCLKAFQLFFENKNAELKSILKSGVKRLATISEDKDRDKTHDRPNSTAPETERPSLLKGIFKARPDTVTPLRAPIEEMDSDQLLDRQFKRFIDLFFTSTITQKHYNALRDTASTLPLFEPLYTKKPDKIGKSIKQLKKIIPYFTLFKHKAFLYKSCKQFMKSTKQYEEKKKNIIKKEYVNVYFASGMMESAIQSIIANRNETEMTAAIKLLNNVMKDQSYEIQTQFLNFLKEAGLYYPFFIFIKNELEHVKNLIIRSCQQKTKANYLGQNCMLYFNQQISVKKVIKSFDDSPRTEILRECIKLLQIACDNCNEPFQKFMKRQNAEYRIADLLDCKNCESCRVEYVKWMTRKQQQVEDEDLEMQTLNSVRPNVNLVDNVLQFLIDIQEAEDYLMNNSKARKITASCIQTLVEFITGPCYENQQYVGENIQLIKFIRYLLTITSKSLVRLTPGKIERDENTKVGISMYNTCINLLNALVEGQPCKQVTCVLIEFLGIDSLIEQAEKIYIDHIKGRERSIKLNLAHDSPYACNNTGLYKGDEDIIASGVGLTMFLLKLHAFKQTNMPNIETFTQGKAFRKFYRMNIGFIQLSRDKVNNEDLYFQIPAKCHMLTDQTRRDLIYKCKNDTHEEKLEYFVMQKEVCRIEMEHQQQHRRRHVAWLTRRWRKWGWISYWLVLIINLYLLARTDSIDQLHFKDIGAEPDYMVPLTCMGVLQLFFGTLSFVSYVVEFHPVIVWWKKYKSQDKEMIDYIQMPYNNSRDLWRQYRRKIQPKRDDAYFPRWTYFKAVAFDVNSIYHYIYIIISIMALDAPFYYAFLLMDIVTRSQDLQNLMASITNNKIQLLYTLLLLVISIYIFSTFGFVDLSKFYVDGSDDAEFGSQMVTYCGNMWEWFVSTGNMGLRSGGGIGDALGQPEQDDDLYWNRAWFDLMFFIIIVIILLNIVAGIIIDTFASLREQRNAQFNKINKQCFICDVNRSTLEARNESWAMHFGYEHSVFAYMAFFVYLAGKDQQDCTGLEKHVKDCNLKSDISFFPKRCDADEDRRKRTNPK